MFCLISVTVAPVLILAFQLFVTSCARIVPGKKTQKPNPKQTTNTNQNKQTNPHKKPQPTKQTKIKSKWTQRK